MAAQTDDKKLDGAGLTTLWGIIKQYIADNPSIPKATASVLGGIMVGTTLAIDNSGVLDLASGIVTAGTYKSVTVDTYGRVTAGSNPNTLAGYGITDAKIDNGAIILGADSITPATQTWVQQQGYTSNIGTVTQVKVGTSAYDPSGGVVSLPAYPTTLPASDVYSWAKASAKPTYTYSEVGAAAASHTHSYLPLSGGTLSGNLSVSAGSESSLTLGTSTSGQIGALYIYASGSKYHKIVSSASGQYPTITLPNKSGTMAVTDDIPTNTNQLTNGAGYITGITKSMVTTALGYTPPTTDTNTWRTVQCNGTSIGSNTLNLKAGTNVSLSNSSGTITINSSYTNTTYSAGTGISLSGTTFSNSGVRAVSIKGNYLRVNTNGSNSDLTVAYATNAGMVGGYGQSDFLHTTGGVLTGNASIEVSNAAFQVTCPSVGSIALHAATSGNRGLYDEGWVIHTNGTNTYLSKGGVYAPNGFYAGSLSGTGIQIARYDGTPHDDVIERYGGAIWLQYYSGNNVAIGQASSTYKLNVAGTCGATGFTNTSDIRKKNIIKDGLSVRITDIANAPLFDFTWKDVSLDKDLHIGSSAQYWKNVIPEAVSMAKDEIGTLSMQYDVIALASCISVAKETLTLKEKVALLETRVESLEKKIREYESN